MQSTDQFSKFLQVILGRTKIKHLANIFIEGVVLHNNTYILVNPYS